MARWWVSWWSGNYGDEGCTAPPFQTWCSGTRFTREDGRDEESYCAVIDTKETEASARIKDVIRKHFPDAEMRFIEAVSVDWKPGDRFPDFDETRTDLEAA